MAGKLLPIIEPRIPRVARRNKELQRKSVSKGELYYGCETKSNLAAGTRSNLLLLQKTTVSLERTQLRLATGNKINTALEGPASFFAAKGLNQRAGDLNGLKDGIGQAISTIKSADTGITNIEELVEQARGLTTQALGSVGQRRLLRQLCATAFPTQFNTLLRQIDRLAEDANYQGKNLLVGRGLRLDATCVVQDLGQCDGRYQRCPRHERGQRRRLHHHRDWRRCDYRFDQ